MAEREGQQIDTLPVQIYGQNENEVKRVAVDDDGNLLVGGSQLNQIQSAIAAIRSTIGIAADLRVTLLSGTVTTVSTVTNIASVGGIAGAVPMNALMNLAYIQSNGNNIA